MSKHAWAWAQIENMREVTRSRSAFLETFDIHAAQFSRPIDDTGARALDQMFRGGGAQSILNLCVRSQNYAVETHMVRLIENAAASLPDEPFMREDLPAKVGFCVLQEPLDSRGGPMRPLAGLAWLSFDDQGAICIGLAPDRGGLSPESINTMTFGHRPVGDVNESDASMMGRNVFVRAFIRTLWIIMQQKLPAEIVPEKPPRPMLRRASEEIPDLLVVQLRKREQAHRYDGDGDPVEWTHRWLVSGHWRNQWIPSRNIHRQQWISAYIKGPEDKPLVVKDWLGVLNR